MLVNAALIDQAHQRHILSDDIMWNQQIGPWLAAVAQRMARGVAAPLHRGVFLGLHLGILHVIARLGFEHIDAVRRFRYEVWLVFTVVDAEL